MAKLIKTDGTVREVKPSNGKSFSLEELQRFVGGYIEIISLPNGNKICVNEEGKIAYLPPNERATEIWKKEYPDRDELIVGDILLVENLMELD